MMISNNKYESMPISHVTSVGGVYEEVLNVDKDILSNFTFREMQRITRDIIELARQMSTYDDVSGYALNHFSRTVKLHSVDAPDTVLVIPSIYSFIIYRAILGGSKLNNNKEDILAILRIVFLEITMKIVDTSIVSNSVLLDHKDIIQRNCCAESVASLFCNHITSPIIILDSNNAIYLNHNSAPNNVSSFADATNNMFAQQNKYVRSTKQIWIW